MKFIWRIEMRAGIEIIIVSWILHGAGLIHINDGNSRADATTRTTHSRPSDWFWNPYHVRRVFCLPYCHQFWGRGVNAQGMTSRYTGEIKEFRSQLSESVILMRRPAGSSVFLAKRIDVELKTFSCNCFDGWMMDNVEWFCLFAGNICLIHCCNNREGKKWNAMMVYLHTGCGIE